MNHRLFIALILIWTLACGARAEAADYVRLHVVAADDTHAAQALKLKVRDAVLMRARALLADAEDADAAWRIVTENIEELEAAARCVTGDIACETGVFAFPDRWYGGALVPAGEYRALRVVIGAGEGRNWWCVLYPSMCYPEHWKTEDGAFYSSTWRWLQSMFGGDGA